MVNLPVITDTDVQIAKFFLVILSPVCLAAWLTSLRSR
jgi:hypothetical protein